MRSPKPEAHDKVLDNNPDRIGIWKCWFLRRGETRRTRRRTSRSKEENQQQTQPTYESGTHWWEASAFTTAPTLLPELHCIECVLSEVFLFREISNSLATGKQSGLLVKRYNLFIDASFVMPNLQLWLQSH